ncbi:MAG: hypothetical protein KIT80_08770 [Chitinophagaceae bacterium]|nr:hypothetical protein [Chitinophagaceae bacterium]MCW5926989.1 hypothetical protein [Chitinophagaceae bacterium]
MNIILFDNDQRHLLYPFTYTKPVAALFCGLFNNLKRWELYSGLNTYALTAPYLQSGWELPLMEDILLVDGSILPDKNLVECILQLNTGAAIVKNGALIAGRISSFSTTSPVLPEIFSTQSGYSRPVSRLQYPWHLFQLNAGLIKTDHSIHPQVPENRISPTNKVSGTHNISAGSGLVMEHCFLNTSGGPIVIGNNVTILEGSIIYGPFSARDNTVIKAGSKLYQGISIGNSCTVGGEIKNSIIMHFSNKAHDGYLGDSVVGEWCNLGAGTSNSNVKNDATPVKVKLPGGETATVGLKCGLLMGDYSRSAINTSFNTGTIAGVSCNIFGAGLTPGYLPNFTWGFSEKYLYEKALAHISNWKQLKQQQLTENERQVLDHLYHRDT